MTIESNQGQTAAQTDQSELTVLCWVSQNVFPTLKTIQLLQFLRRKVPADLITYGNAILGTQETKPKHPNQTNLLKLNKDQEGMIKRVQVQGKKIEKV